MGREYIVFKESTPERSRVTIQLRGYNTEGKFIKGDKACTIRVMKANIDQVKEMIISTLSENYDISDITTIDDTNS